MSDRARCLFDFFHQNMYIDNIYSVDLIFKMRYEYNERKIVCVISDNIETWQAMNVIGHLSIGLGANKDIHLMGRSVLRDASGSDHKGIARYGFIIKKGNTTAIRKAIEASHKIDSITAIDFHIEMLDTCHDDQLLDQISIKDEKDFEYI